METSDPTIPNLVIEGETLVSCDINYSTCPVRRLRENQFSKDANFMCQHKDTPKLSGDLEELLTYRTCVTKERG